MGAAEADMRFAPRLFVGRVMHHRFGPRPHHFRYRVYALWLDLDRLEETAGSLRLFRQGRFGVFSFSPRDHGPKTGAPLRPWVDAELAAAGRPRPARVMLLAMPRLFGYVFNPLSVYYCYDESGRLESVLYQVKNTVFEQKAYVAAAQAEPSGAVAHAVEKSFWVSPFIDMAKTYRFRLIDPDRRLALKIDERDAPSGERCLIATWNADAEPLTDRALARRLFTHPLMTFKVILGIHFEAVRLLLKGAPFLNRARHEGRQAATESGA